MEETEFRADRKTSVEGRRCHCGKLGVQALIIAIRGEMVGSKLES